MSRILQKPRNYDVFPQVVAGFCQNSGDMCAACRVPRRARSATRPSDEVVGIPMLIGVAPPCRRAAADRPPPPLILIATPLDERVQQERIYARTTMAGAYLACGRVGDTCLSWAAPKQIRPSCKHTADCSRDKQANWPGARSTLRRVPGNTGVSTAAEW